LDFSFAMLGIAAVGLLIGIAVGCVGIGGVLMIPILTLALGIDIKHAIAAALLSYLPSGFVAVALYARRGSVPWREAWLLCLAALPAAYFGARAASLAPPGLLETLIGLLLLAGGIYALRGAHRVAAPPRPLAAPLVLGLGGGTGFVSALTGAGGAFVLLPILLLLDVPVLSAIGLGQAIAIPIAGVASLANAAAGLIDPILSAVLAVSLVVGIAIGTPIAHALPQPRLRRLLGGIVLMSGVAMLARVAARLI
jgi:uncharacterized membrane protein YfcA